MKRILSLAGFISLLAFSTLTTLADDLAKVEGKWSVKKTNEDGQTYTQVLEVKKDKFKFRMLSADNQLFIYAEGEVKLEKLGPFNVAKFVNIKGGVSESDIQPIDDDHTFIYLLSENKWTMVANFDKERDQKPSMDIYTKAAK